MENLTKNGKIIFTNIDKSSWEHPADRATLNTLKGIPALDDVLKAILGNTSERAVRLTFLSSSVKVSETQLPHVYEALKECCQILDSNYIPDLYISQNPMLNAGAIGVDKPFIMLNSEVLKDLKEDEIMYIIGHELGHILSGHGLYRTLAWIIVNISSMFFTSPYISIALQAVYAALMEWSRKSELSADRAGLLCVQDENTIYKALMKMAGGTLKELDVNEFLKQAEDYDSSEHIADSIFKLVNTINITHPFPVERVREIQKWKESYDKIIAGEYKKRDEKEENFFNQYKDAFEQYKNDLKSSNDPLNKTISTVTDSLEQAADQLNKTLGNIFNIKK